MTPEKWDQSTKITNSLIERIGLSVLQEACDALLSQSGKGSFGNKISNLESAGEFKNHEKNDLIKKVQVVYDIKYAWHMAMSTAVGLSIYFAILLYVGVKIVSAYAQSFMVEFVCMSFFAVLLLFLIVFFRVWKAHQPAVVFEFDSVGRVSFCAQDMENSILDYLLFRKLRNTWKRRYVLLSDIYRIDNEIFHTGRQKSVKYFSINISGEFGSQKIVFSNKQKRDECRALFLPAIKNYAKNARMDSNLSMGSTEGDGY